MEDSLKKELQEIVDDTINGFKEHNLTSKRIVLYNSNKGIKNLTEIFNYIENLFLNDPFKIEKGIRVKVIDLYDPQKDRQEEDYPIDVGDLLRSIRSRKASNPKAF